MDVEPTGTMDELVRGLKAGQAVAFETLVRDYGDRIYRFARRLVGERFAEDVTQEVFIRVHRSIDAYQPSGRFESWLFTIANNLCIDAVRRRRPEEPLAVERFASGGQEPDQAAETNERRRALLRAVERLPVDQRQVFLLREEGGLTFKEIAEMVGCPLNTALGRMHYAMENLRKALKAYGMR